MIATGTNLLEQRPLSEFLELSLSEEQWTLPYPLGSDQQSGELHIADLIQGNLFVSGTTGSGKTMYLKGIVRSLTNALPAEDLKLILFDLKSLDFGTFNSLPHLMCPMITDVSEVNGALGFACHEMLKRRDLLCKSHACNLDEYRAARTEKGLPPKLPYIVIVLDEIQTIDKASMDTLVQLSQQGRASGIFLILSTQRPDATVGHHIGRLKCNISSRISFRLPSGVDSRVAIDRSGAEKLKRRELIAVLPFSDEGSIQLVAPLITDEDITPPDRVVHSKQMERLPSILIPQQARADVRTQEFAQPVESKRKPIPTEVRIDGYHVVVMTEIPHPMLYRPTYCLRLGNRASYVDLISQRLICTTSALPYLGQFRSLTSRQWEVVLSVKNNQQLQNAPTTAIAWTLVQKGAIAASKKGFVLKKALQKMPVYKLRDCDFNFVPISDAQPMILSKRLIDNLVNIRSICNRLWQPGLSEELILGLPYFAETSGVVTSAWTRRSPIHFNTGVTSC